MDNIFKYKNDSFKSIKDLFEHYHVSKSNRYKILSSSNLRVNGNTIKDPDYCLDKGDIIEINDTILKTDYEQYNYEIKVLYEDNDILIVYKPSGMLVHPDGISNKTLVNAVSYYYRNININFNHLHRLDVETSGMIIFSKNIFSYCFLSNEWENKNVSKEYICLVEGLFNNKIGTIDKNISKDRHSNKQIVSKNGLSAITKYKVIKENRSLNQTKLSVNIIGGRKHQIRVHLSSVNHPIIGDKLYNPNYKSGRMYLEFVRIEFIHPRTNLKFKFECTEEF